MSLYSIRVVIILTALMVSSMAHAYKPPDYEQQYRELQPYLENGNDVEKLLAINSLSFLTKDRYLSEKEDLFYPILRLSEDKSSEVRLAIAEYFAKNGKSIKHLEFVLTKVIPMLLKLSNNDDPSIRIESIRALGGFPIYRPKMSNYIKLEESELNGVNERISKKLIKRANDAELMVRLEAVRSLGERGDGESVKPLLGILSKEIAWPGKILQQEVVISLRKIRRHTTINPGYYQVATALGSKRSSPQVEEVPKNLYDKVVMPALRKYFNDEYLKGEIIRNFADCKLSENLDLLIAASEEGDINIKKLAMEAITKITAKSTINDTVSSFDVVDHNIGLLKDQSAEVRVKAVEILGELKDRKAVPSLIEVQKDPDYKVRYAVAEALGQIGDPVAIDYLISGLDDEHQAVKKAALNALGNFNDRKILLALIPRMDVKRDRSNLLVEVFLKVAKKSAQNEDLVIYRKPDGTRVMPKNTRDIPKRTSIFHAIVHPSAVDSILDYLKEKSYLPTKLTAALPNFYDARVESYLIQMYKNGGPEVKSQAIKPLGRFQASKNNLKYLLDALGDKSTDIRGDKPLVLAALRVAAEIRYEKAIPSLIGLLSEDNTQIKRETIQTLKHFRDERIIEAMLPLAKSSDSLIKSRAVGCLSLYEDNRVKELFLELISNVSDRSLFSEVLYFRDHPDPRAFDSLIALLAHEDDAASLAATALEALGDKRAVDPLIKAMLGGYDRGRSFNNDHQLSRAASRALQKFGGENVFQAFLTILADKKRWHEALNVLVTYDRPEQVEKEIRSRFADDKYKLNKLLELHKNYSGRRQLKKENEARRVTTAIIPRSKDENRNVLFGVGSYGIGAGSSRPLSSGKSEKRIIAGGGAEFGAGSKKVSKSGQLSGKAE